MDERLTVTKRALEEAKSDMEYLDVIIDKYQDIWATEPPNPMEYFTEDQVTLYFYGVLYNQVQNGGFLQLIFNRYAQLIFSEPMINGLKAWGATATAKLLITMASASLKVDRELDKTSLESLSRSYSQYPKFAEYDLAFDKDDGTKEVKAYVSSHLADFITVE